MKRHDGVRARQYQFELQFELGVHPNPLMGDLGPATGRSSPPRGCSSLFLIGTLAGLVIALSGVFFGTKPIDAGIALLTVGIIGRLSLALRYRHRSGPYGGADVLTGLGIALALGILIVAIVDLARPSCPGCVPPH